jgi:hypothetical protein
MRTGGMMQLKDREVQDAIELFAEHARICAATEYDDGRGVLGVAAMSTILSCMLTVGEALARADSEDPTVQPSTKASISAFYQNMEDRLWLVPPRGRRRNDSEACTLLAGIRHGLAHAISMPWNAMLVPNAQAVHLHSLDRWRIVVPDFVEQVCKTLQRLTQERGDLSLDEVIKKAKRGPVSRQRTGQEGLDQFREAMLSTATSA